MTMGWDYHTYMAQPEWMIEQVIKTMRKQQEESKSSYGRN
jgi:hypothetical protein